MTEESFGLSNKISQMFENYEEQIQKEISDFTSLLDTLSTAEERKKELWKKIHYNSLIDRRNAAMMFADVTRIIEKDPTQHAVLGQHVAKYLERMSKANDQLIKLAEIVDSKVVNMETTLTSNENILDVIQTNHSKKK